MKKYKKEKNNWAKTIIHTIFIGRPLFLPSREGVGGEGWRWGQRNNDRVINKTDEALPKKQMNEEPGRTEKNMVSQEETLWSTENTW